MKATGILILGVALLVGACGAGKRADRSTTVIGKKNKKVEAESVWNGERLWTRVADVPPTYHPTGFKESGSGAGVWITDRRDGKKIFVPEGGVNGIPESVLHAEALKATGASKKKRKRKE